ncbi:ResB-like family cytochrome c biogenesis protein [Syntrophotalea carbinolica DSM 2380]|uniref:ResB-like family cytochrome c biogenesis protein n=1 Tax=Syntrophotalea carbinolica (strain DSM 2380 / NBRC 103641 / GraBd1) TaxID=338963 RepID=Q3A2D9_SYNC1|nr:cytochrome c biogenesis protein ResB [Syntrophotalea carbinolica]ABA89468.1 ResB-like family cytochrome c biogenesis protein [Syntrophotalea carbinolica DSM 2380]
MSSGTSSPLHVVLWNGLRSLKLTLVSLFLLAGSSVLGTLLPQNLPLAEYHQRLGPVAVRIIRILQLDNMYHSWWFYGLLGLFALNLSACSVHRLPGVWRQIFCPQLMPEDRWLQSRPLHCNWLDSRCPEVVTRRLSEVLRGRFGTVRRSQKDGTVWLFVQRHSWARLGAYVTHLAILIILLGGVVGGKWGYRGYLTIAEGQAVAHLPLVGGEGVRPLGFSVRCDQFVIDYYANGYQPREFRSLLTILEDGREVPGHVRVPVRVNHPLRYRGLTFYQSGYDTDAGLLRFSVTPRGGGEPFDLMVVYGQSVLLPDGTALAVAGYISDFEGKGPAAGLELTSPDGQRGRAMAFQDPDLLMGEAQAPYVFRLLSIEPCRYTGLQVSRDPGVPLVWLGCLLLVVGTLAAFYFSHQRLWLRLQGDAGGTRVLMAGHAHRQQGAFSGRFEVLCQEFRNLSKEQP